MTEETEEATIQVWNRKSTRMDSRLLLRFLSFFFALFGQSPRFDSSCNQEKEAALPQETKEDEKKAAGDWSIVLAEAIFETRSEPSNSRPLASIRG